MGVATSIAKAVASEGYVVLRAYEQFASPMDAFIKLGVVDEVEGLNTLQILTPKRVDEAQPNTYSGNFGISEFPLHTDLAHWAIPPRYLALRCEHGSKSVATRLVDGELLIKEFGEDVLRMALVQPRRPMKNGRQLLRLGERTIGEPSLRLRWDEIFLKPANGHGRKIFASVRGFLASTSPLEVILIDRGDTLVIDNWRWLHGRSPVGDGSEARKINRAYMRSLV